MSLVLKWGSCRQDIYGSRFCIHSVSRYLFVGTFNPFAFKVIIDKSNLTGIILTVLGVTGDGSKVNAVKNSIA